MSTLAGAPTRSVYKIKRRASLLCVLSQLEVCERKAFAVGSNADRHEDGFNQNELSQLLADREPGVADEANEIALAGD